MAENYVYGVNLPASQLKTVLADMQKNQQGVSTWNQILGAASLGYQKQQSALTQQYGDVITEAYKAHLGANREIANLGLNEAQRAEQFGLSALDLENTYNKYLSGYVESAQALADQYSKNISAIDNVLTEEAENYSKLLNSAYTYLSEELYPATYTDNKGNTVNYLDKSMFSKYINSKTGGLMSAGEVFNNLFDADGQLTDEGQSFFDAIYNAQDMRGYVTTKDNKSFNTRSFDQWLSDTDAELRNFYSSIDPYNFNFAGTRKGTLQQILGMESIDNKYDKNEYLQEIVDDSFNPEIIEQANKIINKYSTDYIINKNKSSGYAGFNKSITPEIKSDIEKITGGKVSYIKTLDTTSDNTKNILSIIHLDVNSLDENIINKLKNANIKVPSSGYIDLRLNSVKETTRFGTTMTYDDFFKIFTQPYNKYTSIKNTNASGL